MDTFILDLEKINWKEICSESNPEVAVSMFNNVFCQLLDKHAPLKRKAVKTNRAPWVDTELKASMSLTYQL